MNRPEGNSLRRSIAHTFAFALGAVYLVVGIAGFFVTGFDNFLANGDEALLIFEVNPFHNVVHLGVGALALSAGLALRDRAAVQGTNLGIAAVYLLAAALGFAGYLQILSIDGTWAADNFLHLGTGLVALAFSGLVTRTAVKHRAERTPATAVGVGPSRGPSTTSSQSRGDRLVGSKSPQ